MSEPRVHRDHETGVGIGPAPPFRFGPPARFDTHASLDFVALTPQPPDYLLIAFELRA